MKQNKLACIAVCRRQEKRNRRRFTLVELLLVSVMLLILSGLVLPVLHAASESGRSAGCTDNLKQFGIISNAYLQDYGYYAPWAGRKSIVEYNGFGSWGELFTAVYKMPREMLYCPALKDPDQFRSFFEIGYGMNWRYVNGSEYHGTMVQMYTPAKRSDIVKPASTYTIMDSTENGVPPSNGTSRVYALPSTNGMYGKPDAYRHQGQVGILFCDGHAAEVKVANPDKPYDTLGSDNGNWHGGRINVNLR